MFWRKPKQVSSNEAERIRRMMKRTYFVCLRWHDKMQRTEDLKTAERILNHIHRLYRFQIRCQEALLRGR